ncbi:MAG TPA: IS110 family transposase [Firmicutes bacterium]|nr:IS110 family transposase [Bacillota bacterium]
MDKQVKRELTAVSNPLLSVPGLGRVFTAGISAEIGDISRFATEAALAKYAGLTCPLTNSWCLFECWLLAAIDLSRTCFLICCLVTKSNLLLQKLTN